MTSRLTISLFRTAVAVGLIAAGVTSLSTPCAANTAVTLRPDVTLKGHAVRLSDLFDGVPAGIDRDIAQAPPPCKPAVYDENVLNKLADTYRLDWQPQASADHAVVSAACARITDDTIRGSVTAKLNEQIPARQRSFEISFDTHNLEIDLPTASMPDFTLADFAYDAASHRFRTNLTAQTDRGPYTLPITGHVAIKRSLPVLARRLEAGTTIGASDLDWQDVPEERISADVITDADQLIGHELRRDTADGDILRAHDVIPPRLVLRGSLVTMRIETPFITITAQGKSQQDGAKGETISVVNTQSNRVIEGVVTGPGVIEIHTAQRLASSDAPAADQGTP
jgi:flagella basal body P-ring formation protein FlgA